MGEAGSKAREISFADNFGEVVTNVNGTRILV